MGFKDRSITRHLLSPCPPPEILGKEGEVKFYIDKDQEYPHDLRYGWKITSAAPGVLPPRKGGGRWSILTARPYLGYPYYSRHDDLIHNPYHNDDCPPMRGFYRWHVADPIFFEEDLKVTVQQRSGVG